MMRTRLVVYVCLDIKRCEWQECHRDFFFLFSAFRRCSPSFRQIAHLKRRRDVVGDSSQDCDIVSTTQLAACPCQTNSVISLRVCDSNAPAQTCTPAARLQQQCSPTRPADCHAQAVFGARRPRHRVGLCGFLCRVVRTLQVG